MEQLKDSIIAIENCIFALDDATPSITLVQTMNCLKQVTTETIINVVSTLLANVNHQININQNEKRPYNAEEALYPQ